MVGFTSSKSMHKSSVLLDGVQYLRGLCAIIVVISHCNGIIAKPEFYSRMVLPDWHVASLFAVAAFFSISGFIIVIASLDRSGHPRTDRSEFVRRRFIRIVPFLWLCTIGYNLLSWLGTSQVDWPAAARTLVAWPIGELKPNVVWSLRHELLFYLIYALAMLGERRRPWILIAWFAISSAFYAISYDLGVASELMDNPWFGVAKVFMGGDHGANFQFAIGMVLAYLYLLRPDSLPIGKVPPWAMIVLTAVACLIVTAWESRLGLAAIGLPVAMLWTALAIPVLASAVCARPASGSAGKAGLVLGNASFAIYLVHNPVVLILLAVARKARMDFAGTGQLAAFLGFSIAAAVLAGIVAHYTIEAPLIRACDRWTRKLRRGAPSAIAA